MCGIFFSKTYNESVQNKEKKCEIASLLYPPQHKAPENNLFMCLLMYVQDVRVLPCMNGSNSPGRKVQKSTSPHPKNFSALFFITLPWIFHSLLAWWLCHFLFAFFPINEVKKKIDGGGMPSFVHTAHVW